MIRVCGNYYPPSLPAIPIYVTFPSFFLPQHTYRQIDTLILLTPKNNLSSPPRTSWVQLHCFWNLSQKEQPAGAPRIELERPPCQCFSVSLFSSFVSNNLELYQVPGGVSFVVVFFNPAVRADILGSICSGTFLLFHTKSNLQALRIQLTVINILVQGNWPVYIPYQHINRPVSSRTTSSKSRLLIIVIQGFRHTHQ